MLGKFHVSLSNRLLHLATTKLAIVLYFGYTVNIFWLGSGRLPVKLNYNECQQHITISFSKHEAQFSGKQPYAMFSHTSFSTQRAEFSCCLGRKKKKVSGSPLIRKKSWIYLVVRQRSVWNGTRGKVIPFPRPGDRWQQGCGAFVWTGAGRDWLPWSGTYFKAAANTTKSCWRQQACQSEEGFQTEARPLWEYRNLFQGDFQNFG